MPAFKKEIKIVSFGHPLLEALNQNFNNNISRLCFDYVTTTYWCQPCDEWRYIGYCARCVNGVKFIFSLPTTCKKFAQVFRNSLDLCDNSLNRDKLRKIESKMDYFDLEFIMDFSRRHSKSGAISSLYEALFADNLSDKFLIVNPHDNDWNEREIIGVRICSMSEMFEYYHGF